MRKLLLLAILCACVSGCATTDRNEAKQSDEAAKTAANLREKIHQELKTLQDHPWAGEYYEGDGLGENVSLSIAPEAGYVFEWHGCLGVYDRNYGSVAFTNGKLRLSFTFKNERKGFQGIAQNFIPVPWGKRAYLIPADDVIGFCNRVNNGMEPRDDVHGSYLLREGDEKKRVSGFPLVPDDFRGYLLAKPIVAEITGIRSVTTRPSVCKWKFKDTTVIIDAGKNKGLRTGMEMNIIQPDVVESVIITKVGDTQSEAVMTQAGEDEPGPQKGWRLSTRCRWIEERDSSTPATHP